MCFLFCHKFDACVHIIYKTYSWVVNKISTIYVKELNSINEIFKENSLLPNLFKRIILFFKQVLCILTIKENGICVLPYKNIKNKAIINVITKIIAKNTQSVVLSNYLNNVEYVTKSLINRKVHIYNGKILSNYLIYNFVEYISKLKNEETYLQEVSILVNNCNSLNTENIIYLANKLKRINIVTNKINNFNKISTYLENKMGIGITITNNKRKSLAKAKIIINIDFNEETLNQFNINKDAIIVNINNSVEIKTKLFNGINVYDYYIEYDKKLDNELLKYFDQKLIYESMIIKNNYDEIMESIVRDNLQIVDLVGKNGIINEMEYKRN